MYVKNGEDVFVATFSVIQSPDGRLFSYATWTADDERPVAEDRYRGDWAGRREASMVEWQKVVEVVGDMMEAVDIYPPRFRVREFPTEKQLKTMGNMLK